MEGRLLVANNRRATTPSTRQVLGAEGKVLGAEGKVLGGEGKARWRAVCS